MNKKQKFWGLQLVRHRYLLTVLLESIAASPKNEKKSSYSCILLYKHLSLCPFICCKYEQSGIFCSKFWSHHVSVCFVCVLVVLWKLGHISSWWHSWVCWLCAYVCVVMGGLQSHVKRFVLYCWCVRSALSFLAIIPPPPSQRNTHPAFTANRTSPQRKPEVT